jgi:probable phosphoglycerate mutase
MPARVVLIRHGQTEWSKTGRHTGRTDVPLLEEGSGQARRAGALLRAHGFATFSQVLTSPLSRAADTCALAGFKGEADPDLMEWDYGEYEGLTSHEIRETQPGWTLWDDGVPGGERASDVGRRADRVIEKVLGQEGDTLCVAHGHVLRVLAARWLGLPPVAGRLFLLFPGHLCILGWEREYPAVELWNVAPDVGRDVDDAIDADAEE